jgi:GxxExxY protein
LNANLLHSDITEIIIGSAIKVHKTLGPGLFESTYQQCLAYELLRNGQKVEEEVALDLEYEKLHIPSAYRVDLIVNESVIVELKSVSELTPVFEAQLLTYLKLSGCRVGLLINFNVPILKKGIKRFII